MIIDLSNKVIVITGSSKGLGRELAIEFAKEKAFIVLNYSDSDNDAQRVYNDILSFNSHCIIVKADISKKKGVDMLYKKTVETFGKIDVLINNAGICDDSPIQLMNEDQWRKVIEVNLTGAFLCSQAFSQIMIEQKKGKIINISSLKGQEGNETQINYSTSKAGLIGFTKSLAKELGRYNISVNAVCPGFVVTDMNKFNLQKKEIAVKRSSLNATSSLSDYINFMKLLASDRIEGVSGRVFNLDSRIM